MIRQALFISAIAESGHLAMKSKCVQKNSDNKHVQNIDMT